MISAGHKFVLEKYNLIKELTTKMSDAKYLGWAEDEIIDGVKKHQNVDYWTYYKIEHSGTESFFCVKNEVAGGRILYSFEDVNEFKKIKGIKHKKVQKDNTCRYNLGKPF